MANRILLVEDDAVLRGGLNELFEREGYAVVPAASTKEARERLSGDIDLIVLDVTLPDGDGVSLCREWRAAGVRQGILFLTDLLLGLFHDFHILGKGGNGRSNQGNQTHKNKLFHIRFTIYIMQK